MLAFFITLVLFSCAGCAGCAGLCAGFVQGCKSFNTLNFKGFLWPVQGFRHFVRFPLCVCVGASAGPRVCTHGNIYQKPCTPCTDIFNLLKKRGKIILKPCTNPAQYPAHPAQLTFWG